MINESRRIYFLIALWAFSLFNISGLRAQGFADEDDDSVEVLPAEDLSGFNEAEIRLDGELYTVSPEISVSKNDSIDISVRHLQPNTYVAVHVKKGGVTVKKTGWFCNEKGELDLMINTGGKLQGNASIYYFAGSGKRVQLDVKVVVE